MMEINNVNELIDALGYDKVNSLVTEFLLLQNEMAKRYETISKNIDVSKYIKDEETDIMQ